MTVTIQGHSYEMGRKEFNKYIKHIKNMIPKKPTIIAVEKSGHAEMRNDVFKNQKELTNSVTQWNKLGYKVQYTRGI